MIWEVPAAVADHRFLSALDRSSRRSARRAERRGDGTAAAVSSGRREGRGGRRPYRQVDANDTDIEGYKPPSPSGPFSNIDYYQNVTSRYVETMGIPVVEGRSFLPSDSEGPYVALVNE